MDAVQLDFFADDPDNSPMLLSALGDGIQNPCGVYTENVLEFREGLFPHNYVCVRLCAEGDFIIFEFSYQAGTYGCGHPLCRPCHECHRKNSAHFLAECIYNAIHNTEFAADLKHKHAAVLAVNSKAHFKQAVKLDNELKGLIDNDAKEKI